MRNNINSDGDGQSVQWAHFQTNWWAVLKSYGQFSMKSVIITDLFLKENVISELLFENNLFVRCWFKDRLQMQDRTNLRWTLENMYGQNCPILAESNGHFWKRICRIAHCPSLLQSLHLFRALLLMHLLLLSP